MKKDKEGSEFSNNRKDKLTNTKYMFSVRDLVIIAVLCALGGVMSTYVKYLANIINIGFGVPFGAAQLVAGLHVLWLVLCFGLVRKIGTGTVAGFLKGVIELFTGNPHGLVVVLISGIEGMFIDGGMLLFRKKHAIYSYGFSAGLAAASEVFVFYPLFFPSLPIAFMLATSALAFGSGVVFGGFFGTGTLELLHIAKVAKIPNWQPTDTQVNRIKGGIYYPDEISKNTFHKIRAKPLYLASLVFVIFFIVSGFIYFTTVNEVFNVGVTCDVEGEVENPYAYDPDDFKSDQVTIRTKLEGSYTIEGEKEYTGVPLNLIINNSGPKDNVTTIKVIGSDGYTMEFDWENVKTDNRLILIQEDDKLRLIAGDYDLSYSVRLVSRIVVE